MNSKTIGLALLAAAVMAPSTALAYPKVSICHKSGGNSYHVIKVSQNAVPAHLAHGDVVAGVYYADTDGDGFGSHCGATSVCPGPGFVANSDDCNDADVSVSPISLEVCGDGADNNCNYEMDEACDVCPCFVSDDIDEAWAAFQQEAGQTNEAVCTDEVFFDPEAVSGYEYVQVVFQRQSYNYPLYEYDYWNFYSINWDDSSEEVYCETTQGSYVQNYETAEASGVNDAYSQPLTDAEHASCVALLRDWSSANGLTCE
jgi:hypothetical protein